MQVLPRRHKLHPIYTHMTLQQLSILNYRNIADADLQFSPKINCFVGHNGQGKTNLLDAIYFLSFTHSSSGSLDGQNIRHTATELMLAGHYDLEGAPEHITVGLRNGQKKVLRRNQKAYQRMTEHIGLLPLILISPSDNALILSGSEERRRYMDQVIAQFNPTYLHQLQQYNQLLKQRNTLLKTLQNPEATPDEHTHSTALIDIYDEQMAEAGEYIYEERTNFIEQLIPIFQQYYTQIADSGEAVTLHYVSHCQRGPLLDVLHQSRPADIAVGYSLHGIQRDDLEMLLDGYPIRKEGSQGQNKTYLISLRLAQFDFLRHTGSHTTPILLLDDLFDRLDSTRVERLITLVAGEQFGQIFITDTNRQHLDRILQQSAHSDYRMYTVAEGHISPTPTLMRRSNAESLTEILRYYLREEGLETPLNQYRLVQAWPQVMGEGINRYTQNIFIKNQTLFVKISSAVLRNDLHMSRTTLVQRLNDHVGAQVITDIHFY